MYNYDTVTEALADLKIRGFKYDFNLGENIVYCKEQNGEYTLPQLEVMEIYRFEGNTDPGDEAVVYAIAAADGAHGTFVNAYGAYADAGKEAILMLRIVNTNKS